MKRVFNEIVPVPAVYRLVVVSTLAALALFPVQRAFGGEGDGGEGLLQQGNLFAAASHGSGEYGVFVENRHDIRDTRGMDRSDIVFMLRGREWDVFFRRTGVSYVFHRVAPQGNERFSAPSADTSDVFPCIEGYRVDVEFVQCLPSVRLEAASLALDAVRYYTAPGVGGLRRAFTRIVYRDVYEGIDIVFSTESGRLKYDVVVSPWADPSVVSMRYHGAAALLLDADGGLSIGTPFGVLRELAPVAFACGGEETGCEARSHSGMVVPAAYRVRGLEVSFVVGPYPRGRTLVIDPGLVWSTYYGGEAEDWAAGIARDAGGNVYVAGRTRSLNFPVQAGYRVTSAGGWDAFLVKLNALGQRVWATYIGGSDLDYGFGVAVDATGGPVICGWTKSDDFPVLHAAQPARGGEMDAFVAAFRSDGTLRWSTYCGGSQDDRAMSVAADAGNGIVTAGWTLSIDFPTVSPFQATQAGFSDMIVVKYDTAGSVLWATYFGGSGLDEALDVTVTPGGTAYVCGRTGSSDFPVAGAAQPAPAGNVDASVVALTAGGARIWATYHGGDKDECAYAVACDAAGNVFCAGSTDSDNLPVLNALQKKHALFLDAWVAKYSPAGSLLWSTYYGGNSSDIPADAACDAAGNVIIAGSSGSTSLPLLNAPMQKREGDDAFIARFSGNGGLLFAAFVGGGNNEGATGVAWAGGQSAVMAGTTNSLDFPLALPIQGAHGGGVWDAFVLKIEDCPVSASAVPLGPTRFCPGGNVVLEANDGPGFSYQWYRDGEKEPGGDQRTLVASDSGEYRVMVKNASGCYSLSEPIVVSISEVKVDAGPDTVICAGTPASLRARVFDGTPPFRFRWSPTAGLSDAGAQHPLATPDSTTVYTVTVTDSLNCEARDSVTVEVRTLTVDAGPDVFLCKGESAPLHAALTGGTAPFSYRWSPAEGLDHADILAPTARPAGTTTYTLRVIDALGCAAEDSVTVSVSTLAVSVNGSETVCEGDAVALAAKASGGAGGYRFRWAPDVGLSSTTIPDPVARPQVTTAYQVEVRDAAGCTAQATVVVFVLPRPQVRINATGPLALCRGDSVLLRATPGYPVYAWSTGARTSSIYAREAGTYTVIVRDSLGCEGRDSVEVTVFDHPSPVITPLRPLVFCPGDSTILDAGDGYSSYEWSTGQRSRSLVVRESGEFHVRVANAAGCVGVSPPVTVRTLPAPEPEIHGPDAVCLSAAVSYGTIPSAGRSYRWAVEGGVILSGSDSSSARVMWYEQGRKTISLTVTDDSTGCAGTAHFAVNVFPGPKPRIEPAGVVHLCRGDSVVLDGGTGYVSRRWRGPGVMDDTLQYVIARASGLYFLTVVDSLGCTGRDSVRVFVHDPPRPAIIAEPRALVCEGDTIRLYTDVPYRSYRWSTGDTTAGIAVTREGLYAVSVLDEYGCGGDAPPVFIRVFPKPEPAFTGPDTVCSGVSALYTAPPAPGVRRWWGVENGTVLQSSPDSILVAWGKEEAGRVRLTETVDSSGCSATVLREVRILPVPEPILLHGGRRVVCAGDSVVVRTDRRYAQYLWHDGGTADTCVVKASARVEVSVVDSNGCRGSSRTLDIEVVDPPSPIVEGPRSVCIGATAVYRVQAGGGLSFRWDVTNGTVVGLSNLDSVVVRWGGPGEGNVRIHVRIDSLACEGSAACDVTVSSSLHPRVTLIGAPAFCEGDSVTLDAGEGYEEYTWFDSSGAVIGAERWLKRTTGGAFIVRVKDASGCEGSSDTVLITVFPLPEPVVGGPSTLCEGDTAVLDAGAGYAAYEWMDGSGRVLGGGRFLSVTNSGSYLACVTDANGCRNCSRRHLVTVFPRPPTPVIRKSQDTLYTDAVAVSYSWYRNDTLCTDAESRFLVHPPDGRYRVRIVDENGCTSESEPYEYLEPVTASAVVTLPVVVASPGDVVEIPVVLERSRYLGSASPNEFTAVLRFHRDLLIPLGETPPGTLQGEDRLVPVRVSIDASAEPPIILASLLFRAALGPVDSTPLHLSEAAFNGGKRVDVTVLDGEFHVNVCREGGVRLFDGSSRMFLGRNTPNPFNAQTVIEYEVPGPGPVHLSVYDMLGREIAVLADSYHEKGRYRAVFDACGLSSGIYAYVLRLPEYVLVRWMTLAK